MRWSADDPHCCEYYALASLASRAARVIFSLEARGPSFLEDPAVQPDERVDVASPGIGDLALADVTGDGQDDLVALRTGVVVAVRPVLSVPAPGPYFDAAVLRGAGPFDDVVLEARESEDERWWQAV